MAHANDYVHLVREAQFGDRECLDRLAVLGEKKVIGEGTLNEVTQNPHPVIKKFFGGKRGLIRSNYGG